MAIKLILNVGDTVRNINQSSTRYGWVGTVLSDTGQRYIVEYGHKDRRQVYQKENAHRFIEKLVSEKPQCKCVHDELCEGCARKELKDFAHFMRYSGRGLLNLSELEQRVLANPSFWKGHPVDSLQYENSQPKRRVLKKVRRNVISGKTQDELVKEIGYAQGVQQFNTRCIGRSTGQALRIIGEAMCNPHIEIGIADVDHHISEGVTSKSRYRTNDNFRSLVQSLIGNMNGFTFTKDAVVFNPIVTEETYVETY